MQGLSTSAPMLRVDLHHVFTRVFWVRWGGGIDLRCVSPSLQRKTQALNSANRDDNSTTQTTTTLRER